MQTSKDTLTDELPSVFLDVVQVDGVTRESVAVSRSINAPPSKFLGFFITEIPVIALI